MEDAVEAIAHPNIALVKYWGKADVENNIPATPSLSITLDGFTSRTRISRSELPHGGSTDSVYLNGEATNDPKIGAFLRSFRRKHDVPPLLIDSRNNFPTASGLASSASGFAALVSAIDSCCELNLGAEQRSVWARRASASAARSVFGGFVTLNGPHWAAEPLLACDAWPLNVIVAITSVERKALSSTAGMEASRQHSPYFAAWIEQTQQDYVEALAAVDARDFDGLATVAERSCLQMHALMLATAPGLLYWNGTTVNAIHKIRELKDAGERVFFTIDAGPQVKAVCTPESAAAVDRALSALPGVLDTHRLTLGGGVRVAPLTNHR